MLGIARGAGQPAEKPQCQALESWQGEEMKTQGGGGSEILNTDMAALTEELPWVIFGT